MQNETWLSFEDLNNTNKFELSELNPSILLAVVTYQAVLI